MNTNERKNLVAPCGIDCGICEAYTCRDNPQLLNFLITRGIPASKLPCSGCRSIGGNCPVLPAKCETYECIKAKNMQFCFECADYPCNKLLPASDRAERLPHNLKVFQLSLIEKKGIDAFLERSSELKLRYYKGKMIVGAGPQI